MSLDPPAFTKVDAGAGLPLLMGEAVAGSPNNVVSAS